MYDQGWLENGEPIKKVRLSSKLNSSVSPVGWNRLARSKSFGWSCNTG